MYDSTFLKAALFRHPDRIPMTYVINDAYWGCCDQEQLCDLIEAHPLLFPDFVRPVLPYTPNYSSVARKDEPYTDDFGCVWSTAMDGLTGTVTEHPLADWAAFDGYKVPDPAVCMGLGPINWAEESERVRRVKMQNKLAVGGLRHGHTFLQLSDIRGYQNLLFDMADEEPRLLKLIEQVERFNLGIADRYLDLKVDLFMFGEDLGMQNGPMLSPEMFRRYIKPSYTRLMRRSIERGVLVHLHSDGDIRLLADDLVDSGTQVLNLQDLVNGIDWIAKRFKGRLCIELDIDRQFVTPSGTPAQIDALVREEVEKLSAPEGGFAMIYGLYPGVPIENAKAVMDAMERYAPL